MLLLLAALWFGPSPLHAQRIPGQYVVVLRSAPVAAHLRARLAASAEVESGAGLAAQVGWPARLNLQGMEAAAQRARVRAEQSALRRRIEGLRAGAVIAQTDTVLNSVAVSLSEAELEQLRSFPEVAAVYPSVQVHKAMDAALELVKAPQAWAARIGGEANAGAGVKIGIIDTGLDITSLMLQDPALIAPAGFPRFTQSTDAGCISDDRQFTNSKVIVARNYVRLLANRDTNCDAMDRDGHGTFSSTVAAGRRTAAPLASISGVAPKAYLGNYKVFGTPGVNDSASLVGVLTAIDDAVRDGMDVINLSLGAQLGLPPAADPLAQAVKTAVDAGVIVVVAAGNDGPGSGTVASPGIAPEAITVGASSNSRTLALPFEIGGAATVPPQLRLIGAAPSNGPTISAAIGPLPLRDAQAATGSGTACTPLPAASLAGQMVLIARGGCTFQTKVANAAAAGAAAVVLFNNQPNQAAISFNVGSATQISAVMIGNAEGLALRQLLQASSTAITGRIGSVRQAMSAEPSRMAAFSAVGPGTDFGIKPDLSAPGTNIYSATQRNFAAGAQFDAAGFGTSQGTSVSAPLVAGAVALIRQLAPQLTPAQVKSALVQNAARVLTPLADGVSGVMAGGNGLLNLEAAAATPAVVAPSSITFDANPPGASLNRSATLSVTNTGNADAFQISGATVPGSPVVDVRFSTSTLQLAAGATGVVNVSFNSTQPLVGIVEGAIELRSTASGRVLTVPFWGSFTRPVVNLTGVVNAASFSAGSTRIAPGSLISIFGTQLATTILAASALPLPTALGGVRVLINDVEAPLLFVSPTQINAQVPYEIANSSLGTLEVSLYGQVSAPVPVQIAAAAPGIFTQTQTGSGRGTVLHGATNAPVTDADPARPGEVLAVFVNGLGTTSPAATSGAPASAVPLQTTTRTPTASIGGLSAAVSFSGLAPGFVGLYQVNVRVPDEAANGDLPLIITSADIVSNPVTVRVQR